MPLKQLENGLWGEKQSLKEILEGETIPLWLESPESKTGLSYLTDNREDALRSEGAEEFHFVVNVDKAPDRIQERISEWEDEHGKPKEWVVTVTMDNQGRVNQTELGLHART